MSNPLISRPASDPRPGESGGRSVSGEDFLPPVEPPNAAFILQLFVVPAVIVLVIVVVWLGVLWLVQRGRPEDLVRGLEGSNVARWQSAKELADLLRIRRYAHIKRDSATAATLAGILRREIASGSDADEDVMLRFFICRALGEFEVQEGLDVLLLAADAKDDPAERLVRRGAIQAIAVRAHNLRQLTPPQPLDHPELEPTLLRLSAEEDPLIRTEAAYALGRIGTPACIDRLEIMVDDPYADARYNAAVALAHLGSARGVGTLAEMLEAEPLASVEEELLEADENAAVYRVNKRLTIIHNAIQGARALAAQNPSADLRPVLDALAQIVAADQDALQAAHIPVAAVSEARRALADLQARDDE
jgi:HEAT repeat protein